MISSRIESKIILKTYQKCCWFLFHMKMWLLLLKLSLLHKNNILMKKETIWQVKICKLKDLLMIYYWLSLITNSIQELTQLKLKKLKESKNITSFTYIMLYLMPLKIHSIPWNTEFVATINLEMELN